MYLISPDKKQFRANLHCHSTISDGKLTPQQLKEAYKAHDYQVLSITDHEIPCDHTQMSDPDFLLLTGYEAYIRPDSNCKYDSYAPEIHLNLFAKDPHNVKLIGYQPSYVKYLPLEKHDQLQKVMLDRPREYSREYINDFIRTAREHGYLVSYNHPRWSMESEADILAYEGYFSLEICNYACWVEDHLEHNGQLYDKMLRLGKRVYCHSGDDNHNAKPLDSKYSDSFGGATMILADELEYGQIYHAMETGEMYSTMGPVFKEVSFDGEKIHVECSDVVSVHAYYGGKKYGFVRADEGETLTSADITIHPNARYVRVSIVDKQGNIADTRGFFRDELGLPPL